MIDMVKWSAIVLISICITVFSTGIAYADKVLTDAEINFYHETYIDLQQCKVDEVECAEENSSLIRENTYLGKDNNKLTADLENCKDRSFKSTVVWIKAVAISVITYAAIVLL